MASRLGQAARRLGSQSRGLASALAEGVGPSSSLSQPVAATALRAHSGAGASSSGVGMGLPAAAAAALRRAHVAGVSTSAAAAQQAQQADAAAAAASTSAGSSGGAAAPEGATDFAKKELVMLFTCGKCETRAAKAFSKRSYYHGVVIVDCPGCHSKHLIADHLGWFGQKGTVEDFAAEKGNLVVRKLADGTMELSPEDVIGHTQTASQSEGPTAAGVKGQPGAAAGAAAAGQGS